jgi:hypothetical protein
MSIINFKFLAKKINGEAEFSIDGGSNFAQLFFVDSCIHLRGLKDSAHKFIESSNGNFTMSWNYGSEIIEDSVKNKILQFKYNEIDYSEYRSMLSYLNLHFSEFLTFVRPKIPLDKIDSYKPWFQENSEYITEENYLRIFNSEKWNDFNYLLQDLVKNCYPEGKLNFTSSGFSFEEIKSAFDYVYTKVSPRKLIDFKKLTFHGLLDYI